MDRTGQNAGSQLPARSPSAIVVRSDSLIADAWEGGPDALPQIVRQVQESGRQESVGPPAGDSAGTISGIVHAAGVYAAVRGQK